MDAVQDENFLVVYHNCGNTAILTIDSILSCGAKVYHFGNAIDMAEMMPHIPADVIAMGNIDPAREFRNGTPAATSWVGWPKYCACVQESPLWEPQSQLQPFWHPQLQPFWHPQAQSWHPQLQ